MRGISFLEPGMKVSLPSVCSNSTRRALCLLHVELDSGWRILWIVVYCARVELELELELKSLVRLLRVE